MISQIYSSYNDLVFYYKLSLGHMICFIGNVLVLHFNPWVEASAGGLLVPEGLYSPVAKYFGTCFKIRI
jgi:hypothetical protein